MDHTISLRVSLVLTSMIAFSLAYYFRCYMDDLESLATVKEGMKKRSFIVPCSQDYNSELEKFKGCAPTKCGRFILDEVVTEEEALKLLQ